MKISQRGHHNLHLTLNTHCCINAMFLHLVEDIGKVRGREKMVGEIR